LIIIIIIIIIIIHALKWPYDYLVLKSELGFDFTVLDFRE